MLTLKRAERESVCKCVTLQQMIKKGISVQVISTLSHKIVEHQEHSITTSATSQTTDKYNSYKSLNQTNRS